MEKSGFANLKWQTKILLCLMLGMSLIAAGFAVYQFFSYSIAQFIVLGATFLLAMVTAQHKIKIPRLNIKFSLQATFVLWAIFWLGTGGGIVLAAGVLVYCLSRKNFDKKRTIFQIAVNMTAALCSGGSFYAILLYRLGYTKTNVSGITIAEPNYLVALSVLLVSFYAINWGLNLAYNILEDEDILVSSQWNQRFLRTVTAYGIGAMFAGVLYGLFLYFGQAFGLVLMPLGIAAHCAYRIHEHRLELKVKEIGEAGRVHLATVEALATAIDARDQVGEGHVRRTQIYATGIGKKLELPEDQINALRTAALLHDIGKLAVPDHILNKPGRLTPAEMEKVKIHAAVGADILEKVGFSYPVVPTVKYHHEAWDGSGYPEGLNGENIPLTARVLAVADAYDTLRGARPYRGAVQRDEARRYLLHNSGTQFDAKIVDVFLRHLRKFEAEVELNGLTYVDDKPEDSAKSNHVAEAGASQSYVEQIKRANHEVFTLYELAKVFSSSLNLQQTLSLFANKIGEFIPFETCAVYLLEPNGQTAVAVYVEGENKKAMQNKRIKIGEGATGYVLKKQEPVRDIDPGLDFTFSQLELIEEYSAMTSLPLIADDKLIGAVSLYSSELDNYEEEHLRLLDTVSRIAAEAISKSLQHAETETRAMTDPMTGLPNARSLQMQFEKEMARSARTENNFQVLMLDLDGFKAVNDTYGHKIGDRLLKEVSGVMRGQLRDYDFLARYAGDEFVAVIPETSANEVLDLCERLEKAVKEFRLPVSEGVFARVGVSLGAASYPHDGDNFDQMVIAADKAMYGVKSIRKQQQKKQEMQQNAPLPLENAPLREYTETIRVQKPIEAKPLEILNSDSFIVELDESHIVSSAIN